MSGPAPARRSAVLGRTFLHPVYDYAMVGGGVSLLFTALVLARPGMLSDVSDLGLGLLILATNVSHFAASTVRLYTKPGALRIWPRLTQLVPLAFLALLTLALAFPTGLGLGLQKLYLTWSPYHYAAQTYGLGVMYCYRSGCSLGERDKSLLRWACLLPFLHNFVTAPGIGLDWMLSWVGFPEASWLGPLRTATANGLGALVVVAPLALFARLRSGRGAPMPLIAPLMMLANGVWWLVLLPREAFLWATIFHGVQYLAIVLVFHVRDQVARPDNRWSGLHHALRFYALCLLLGFALFQVLPQGFVMLGFGMVESVLLVVAAINVHHFVVDAFIWRLRPGTDNRRIVDQAARPVA